MNRILIKLLAQGETKFIQQEVEPGKTFNFERDKSGHPVTYVHVKNHIKGQYSQESTELLTIFTVEMSQKLLETGIEAATVVLYLERFSMKNIGYQLIKFFINSFENRYR
ncbi:unnamed protein product [Rotaria socialis]|uniref:CRAL-TRIO domain-containing protein n=1 Tax=Rotaria socialis TaxID=392032 RepID=A0A820HFI3_9BILA|nr:unnamed protein product [Rotaria socialis]CAF3498755.1 unnamed protein product [Rotaria socialis]CAF4295301.1 unnamed protein product [Rotaria socialis]CAF4467159.1 unnamed protein product [Rotaria socialis]